MGRRIVLLAHLFPVSEVLLLVGTVTHGVSARVCVRASLACYAHIDLLLLPQHRPQQPPHLLVDGCRDHRQGRSWRSEIDFCARDHRGLAHAHPARHRRPQEPRPRSEGRKNCPRLAQVSHNSPLRNCCPPRDSETPKLVQWSQSQR